MGSKLQIHFGPYLRVKKTAITQFITNRTCPNHNCGRHGILVSKDVSFCPSCGTAIQEYQREIKSESDVRDLLDDDEFVYVGVYDGFDCLIPNRYSPYDLGIDSYEPFALQIKNSLKGKQVKWFCETYNELIGKIKKQHGEENVELLWGLITYYS
jgi:hypothetical protein